MVSDAAPFRHFLLALRLGWFVSTLAASVTILLIRGVPEMRWLAWAAAATIAAALVAAAALWSRRIGLKRLIVANAVGMVALMLAFTLLCIAILAVFPALASLARRASWAYALAFALPMVVGTRSTVRRKLEQRGPIVARARAEGRAGDAARTILFGPGRGVPDPMRMRHPGAYAFWGGAMLFGAMFGWGALFWLLTLSFVASLSYLLIIATIAPRIMLGHLPGRSDLVWDGATEAWEDAGES